MDIETITVADLADPNIDAATLAEITKRRKDLWPAVAQHPNAYPALRDFIAQNSVVEEVAVTEVVEPVVEPVIEPAQPQTPAAPEAPAASSAPAAPATENAASKMASDTKNFFNDAQVNANKFMAEKNINTAKDWPYLAVAGTGLIGFIALFLPAVSVPMLGLSVSFVQAGGSGVVLLLLFIALVAFAVVYLLGRQDWAKLTTAIIATVVGVWAFISAIVNWTQSSNYGASIGFGLILLLIAGIASAGLGVYLLVTNKKIAPKK